MQRPLKALIVAAFSVSFGGCPENAGVSPPLNALFYPVAAATSADGAWLYVVNSNFDLRYNGGTVVTINLASLREAATRGRLGDGCVADTTADGVSVAQRCNIASFIVPGSTRRINPFAVDAVTARYADRERLYVAVRGDGSVTWFDLDAQGGVHCGAGSVGAFCDDAHRVGIDGATSPLGNRLPPDPSALAVDPARGWIVVSHQSTDATLARASLLVDRGARAGSAPGAAPVLLNTVGGVTPGLSAVTLLPAAGAAARSTWVATSRTNAVLNFFQAYPGSATLQDATPYLYRSAVVNLTGLNQGVDNRSIAVDPAPGVSRVFVVSRSPEALLSVDLGADDPTRLTVRDVIPVPPGPSRLLASYDAATNRTLVFVVAYDARRISVVDPAEHRIISETSTNRGPHALVRDPNGQFLYVLDFLDNAIEVLDLRARTAEGAANPTLHRRLLTVGGPF